MPGEGLTHGPPATKKAGGSHHRISQIIRHSLRDSFNGCFALSPVRRACWPPCVRQRVNALRTDTSVGVSGPRDLTVRLKHDRRRAIRVHRSPLLRFVTIGRNAPLHRRRMGGNIRVICPTTQARTPATNWHDGQFAHEGNARNDDCLQPYLAAAEGL
jgi:hypothetical protein